jgi:lipoprotein-releasing system ATP-binding protein
MSNEKKIILQANNIYKSFKRIDDQRLEVLKNITLEIEEGKLSVIVGASGAGKSTLLHILSGLDKPDSGSVTIFNNEITKLNDDKLSKFRNSTIGFVFQFHHLLPEFSAVENSAMPLFISGMDFTQAKTRAVELLHLVGLGERLTHKPSELSGGEQQRVAIARALAMSPKIIFADEPTGNLDSINGEAIHNLFLDLRDKLGITFLMVSHNPSLIEIGDIVYEMKDGLISTRN